jgi:hypothetical protein
MAGNKTHIMEVEMRIVRFIFGVIVGASGLGSVGFGLYFLVTSFSWQTGLLCVALCCLGFAISNVGLALMKGKGIIEALQYLLFLGNGSSMR